MKTIKQIFENVIFRIPDYQRGYSWEKPHLDDFWQDLMNLQPNKVHYTGMISVEEVDKSEYSKWTEDAWIIIGKGDTPYFIVDGQQRLTTIIILIWVISDKMEEGSELNYLSKEKLIEKYIFTENAKESQKSYLFGYHKDNPSYEFLKREIFEQQTSSDAPPLEETVYTNNLMFAKRFFIDKIKKFTQDELGILLDKITKQLKFDFKILEKELDIFIVFETMNNRGKALTNLEKLKNRLIYLSTLLKDENQDNKNKLRDDINHHWKIIYKYLGLNKDRKLDDDMFLQNHWIMYKRYDRREPEFYANDIFDRYFTSKKVIDGEEGERSINDYITSISESAKKWFVMNNPSHPHALEITKSDGILKWLNKINRLGYKSFAPLIMGALVIESREEKLISLLKSIEAYIFLIFDVSFRRSNTGTYHFNAKASELYNSEIKITDIINDVTFWVYGNDDYNGYFDVNSFYLVLKDLFLRENTNGFYDWKFLRYFLFEYEMYLHDQQGDENHGFHSKWKELDTIQYIYPNKPSLACWKIEFKQYSSQQRKFISGSLGNFVLVKRGLDESLCFEEKAKELKQFMNAESLANVSRWSKYEVLQRGLDMLNFMEKRWQVDLGGYEEKIRLLFLDFED